jgi:hypothetical protein
MKKRDPDSHCPFYTRSINIYHVPANVLGSLQATEEHNQASQSSKTSEFKERQKSYGQGSKPVNEEQCISPP